MATEKVGIYRKYHGPIPKDKSGQPLPKNDWPKKRAFRWAVRWFGTEGKRYSKSFKTRKETERFAETKQPDVRSGKANPPPKITLKYYYDEHRKLMRGNLAASTLQMHLRTLRLLADHAGWNFQIRKVRPRDIEGFRATRLKTGISPSSANREVRTLKRLFNVAIARDYIAKENNPCSAISLIKITPKRPRYCRPKEFSAVYHLAPDHVVNLGTSYTWCRNYTANVEAHYTDVRDIAQNFYGANRSSLPSYWTTDVNLFAKNLLDGRLDLTLKTRNIFNQRFKHRGSFELLEAGGRSWYLSAQWRF